MQVQSIAGSETSHNTYNILQGEYDIHAYSLTVDWMIDAFHILFLKET